jgi:hypothetical protein
LVKELKRSSLFCRRRRRRGSDAKKSYDVGTLLSQFSVPTVKSSTDELVNGLYGSETFRMGRNKYSHLQNEGRGEMEKYQ